MTASRRAHSASLTLCRFPIAQTSVSVPHSYQLFPGSKTEPSFLKRSIVEACTATALTSMRRGGLSSSTPFSRDATAHDSRRSANRNRHPQPPSPMVPTSLSGHAARASRRRPETGVGPRQPILCESGRARKDGLQTRRAFRLTAGNLSPTPRSQTPATRSASSAIVRDRSRTTTAPGPTTSGARETDSRRFAATRATRDAAPHATTPAVGATAAAGR
jgi:hypothetical protein